jgi:predicted aspartyl protease
MIIPYKEGNPMVRIEVRCIKGDKNYDAYLDTGAGRTLIPEDDAIKLGLRYAGKMHIITGSGKDRVKLFKSTVSFLGDDFSILVLGKNLPEQAPINR